jgi:hypothetical protein
MRSYPPPPAGRRDGPVGAHSRRGRRAARPRSWSSVFEICASQAGGAGRANGARLDGVARAWPARRNRCREPLQIEQKALTKMRAVARNIDFVSVSEKAPASAFAWVAVRVRIICCYASAIPQSICEALAELFSCRPHRAPTVYSTLRYFPPPKSRIKHPRACGSSARRSLADASVSHCRTVVRPLQRMRMDPRCGRQLVGIDHTIQCTIYRSWDVGFTSDFHPTTEL